MAEDSVSMREFGRQIGRSHVWVQNKVNDGSIPFIMVGRSKKIPIEAGFEAVRKLIKDKDGEDGQDAPPKFSNAREVTAETNKARMKKEFYVAQLKELEFKLRNGDLVERTLVESDASTVASALRQQLMAIPVRVSGLCEGRTTREIEEILEDAINDALTVFQKSEFFKK